MKTASRTIGIESQQHVSHFNRTVAFFWNHLVELKNTVRILCRCKDGCMRGVQMEQERKQSTVADATVDAYITC